MGPTLVDFYRLYFGVCMLWWAAPIIAAASIVESSARKD